jgi:peptidoglycan-associated lipoprotein
MKRLALSAVVVLGLALPGCRSGRQAPPPAPPAPPPVVPATPPPAPPPSTPDVTPQLDEYDKLLQMSSDQIERMGLLADIHFDLDRAELREADRQTLTQNADVLKRFDFLRVSVQGHCDERGSVEYNLALGERRASAVREYLAGRGIGADRLRTVSYGEERPKHDNSREETRRLNRRAALVVRIQ